jgi:uncharacterized protein (TIGR03437 family)
VIANPGASNELRSDPLTLTTQAALAPAIFTFDGRSIAAAAPDLTRIFANPSVVPGGVPARPGDIIVFFATGLGATNPAIAPGEIAQVSASETVPVALTIGEVTVPAADILYVGVPPQSTSAVHQLNVRLPATLADGDAAVSLNVGGIQSPAGTFIPIRR